MGLVIPVEHGHTEGAPPHFSISRTSPRVRSSRFLPLALDSGGYVEGPGAVASFERAPRSQHASHWRRRGPGSSLTGGAVGEWHLPWLSVPSVGAPVLQSMPAIARYGTHPGGWPAGRGTRVIEKGKAECSVPGDEPLGVMCASPWHLIASGTQIQ